MKKLTIILILGAIYVPVVAQTSEYNSIIQNYCQKAKEINWESNSQQEIVNQITKISKSVREDEKQKVNTLKEQLRNDNPTLTEKQIEFEFSKNFTLALVKNCPEYIELSKHLLPNCPGTNKTLEIATRKMDELLEAEQDKSYQDQLELADNSLFNIIMGIEEQAKKDYDGGLANGKLADDVGLYLMHKSKYYFSAYLVTTQLQQLESQYK